ncbi:hypothetical protein K469DRAFT_689964 [Zopfia rhizophila CBS 207.26]|uniref:Uncharacterized protein n=1 Tax=Zopfia rhizophila CBS 207.26 TaxID=1314779 RepID=A0A6A6E0R2_9PEZI|nr:hypothetical protein K469DRAFT_689964 [Zopfia rhizophila CBS 207.26]
MATISRSGSEYYDVHIGFWTNWSYGLVRGSTITLTRRNGGLLIGFLAIFVAMSGKSFWRIACFILHRSFSSPTPQDGLYHQRQAIIRNADTPEDGAWRLLQMLVSWRNEARRPFRRLLPTVFLALFTSAAFIIGGIFSSKVTTDNGNEVLITGDNCGPLDSISGDGNAILTYLQPHLAQRATAHSNYALQCYTNATNSEDCHLFVKPQLRTTVARNASCPFADEMCKTKTENIIVDSGLIDSHDDLGINAPPKERFQMRYVYQCAPIVSEGFKQTLKRSNDSDVPEVVQYFYGNLTYGAGAATEYTGFTYEVLKNYTNLNLPGYTSPASARPEYGLGTVTWSGGDNVTRGREITEFTPIPQLMRDDADTSLFFLSAQGIGFVESVDDLWFAAHEKWLVPISSTEEKASKQLYLTDEPASTMGCTTQLQFCNPNLPKDKRCEPLRGVNANANRIEGLWSEKQLTRIAWAAQTMRQGFFIPNNFAAFIGTSVLSARYNLAMGVNGPLPPNQWELEVEHLVGASLASLQSAFVESANGPLREILKQFQVHPKDNEAMSMCTNQKIISTLYSSFSVLGLSIILILGSILIITDIFLEPGLNYWQTRRAESGKLPHHNFTGSTHSRLEWRVMSVLQLQRLAHEAVGSGSWFKTSSENPITKPMEKLGILDVSDEKRPFLRQAVDGLKELSLPTKKPKRDLRRIQTKLSDKTVVSETTSPSLKSKKSAKEFQIKRVETGLSDMTLAPSIKSPPLRLGRKDDES